MKFMCFFYYLNWKQRQRRLKKLNNSFHWKRRQYSINIYFNEFLYLNLKHQTSDRQSGYRATKISRHFLLSLFCVSLVFWNDAENGIILINKLSSYFVTENSHLNLFATRPQPKKKRKSRTAFTNHQIFELEKRFLYQKYLSPADRDEIAAALGLSNAQVIFINLLYQPKKSINKINQQNLSLFLLIWFNSDKTPPSSHWDL